jgi:hypothetical protein
MRTHLRGLSQSARAALLLADSPDPTLVQAVLEAPGFSSGVSDDMRKQMLEIVVNRDHPDQLAEIAQVEEALELLDAATGIVLSAAKSAAEFPSETLFDAFIDRNAPAVDLPANRGGTLVHQKIEPANDWQKESDEIHARILAEARAELAAL